MSNSSPGYLKGLPCVYVLLRDRATAEQEIRPLKNVSCGFGSVRLVVDIAVQIPQRTVAAKKTTRDICFGEPGSGCDFSRWSE